MSIPIPFQVHGTPRESVTASALKLQRAGLIRYVRGHIVVLDRKGLEAESCECYAVVKSAYDRLDGADLPALPAHVHRHPGVVQARPAAPQPALRHQAFALAR